MEVWFQCYSLELHRWRNAGKVWKVKLLLLVIFYRYLPPLIGTRRIYDLQQSGSVFPNISEMLWAMDPSFVSMLEHSLEAGLKEQGVADLVIEELAQAVMRVNYGQSTQAHHFVGIASAVALFSSLLYYFSSKLETFSRRSRFFSWSRTEFVVCTRRQ